MKKIIVAALAAMVMVGLSGCGAGTPPKWKQSTGAQEREYIPYLKKGNSSIKGQSFLVQRGGTVVMAAGKVVTLDPATSLGKEWWSKVGTKYKAGIIIPPSKNFRKTRRTTIADAEGKFEFSGLPAGRYYIRTNITWWTGAKYEIMPQGGFVGQMVTVTRGSSQKIIVNRYAH